MSGRATSSGSAASPSGLSSATKLGKQQSVSVLEQTSELMKKRKRDERNKSDDDDDGDHGQQPSFEVFDYSHHAAFREPAKQALGSHAIFFVAQITLMSLFSTVFSVALLGAMAAHSYRLMDWDFDVHTLFSLREIVVFIAQRLHIWTLRTKSNLTMKEAVKESKKCALVVTRSDGATVTAGDLFLGRHKFFHYSGRLVIPAGLAKTVVSSSLKSLVDFAGSLLILDEKKQEYHGHAPCIRMIRGKPVVWVLQTAVQCKNAVLPYVYGVWPLATKETPARVDIIKWARCDAPNKTPMVFDSFYSTQKCVSWLLEERIYYMTALNRQWWQKPYALAARNIVDEGDSVEIAVLNGVPSLEAESDATLDDDSEAKACAEAVGDAVEPPAKKKKTKAKKVDITKNLPKKPSKATLSSTTTDEVIGASWHQERNKKTFGLRCVSSNMFTISTSDATKSDTALINTTYGTSYGLGSDAFNRYMAWLGEKESRRGVGVAFVFSWLVMRMIVLSMWAFAQHKWPKYRVTKADGSGAHESTKAKQEDADMDDNTKTKWNEFMDDLTVAALQYALTLSPNPNAPSPTNEGCSCDACKGDVDRHRLENVLDGVEKAREAAEAAAEAAEAKAKRVKEKKERAAERAAKKEERDKEAKKKAQIKAQRDAARAKRLRETTGKCTMCSSVRDVDKLLGCDVPKCRHWVCTKCAGLVGGAIVAARNRDDWQCPSCAKKK